MAKLTISQDFVDECKGYSFLALYDDEHGLLVDSDRFNWWINVGPGRARPAQWVNEERKPIPRATAEALLAATHAQDGGLVMPDGSLADLAWGEPGFEDLTLIPREGA